MMNAFAPQGRRPCLLWSQVECVNVLVLIDNGELREFYELGGSRLIIGELLELIKNGELGELLELWREPVGYWRITRIGAGAGLNAPARCAHEI